MSLARRLALIALSLAPAVPLAAQHQSAAIEIPIEHYTLANGLTVILSPNHSTPTVVVDLFYHVGSTNDPPGRTGLAHLLEHVVLYAGSAHVSPGLHARLTNGVGGRYNGSTESDITEYYDDVPSNHLERALWLEADAMGFLLAAFDSTRFFTQREVVQNERRQRLENQPFGWRPDEIMRRAMYPPSHPYSWSVLGYPTDLQRMRPQDAISFYRTYYTPSNATLSVVGDFDPARAKGWIARYFGDLPRGKPIPRVLAPPVVLEAETRLLFADRVQLPRLYMRWPTTGLKGRDLAALHCLAFILGQSRTSRLNRTLVYERQTAARVFAGYSPAELGGHFDLEIDPRPGNTLTELQASADAVIERLGREGPTADEMERARVALQTRFVMNLESNLNRAYFLNRGAVIHGDPSFYFRAARERLNSTTAEDVRRAAGRYLTGGRVVLSVVPLEKPEQAARPGASTTVTVGPDGQYLFQPPAREQKSSASTPSRGSP